MRGAKAYKSELHALRSFASGDNFIEGNIKILEKASVDGLVPLSALSSEFIVTTDKILKKSRQEKTDKSLFDKAAIRFSAVVHVRKVSADETSTKIEDILARIAKNLESERVDLALKEYNDLPDSYKEMLGIWREKAGNFVASHNASEEIFQYVINSGNKQTIDAKS